MAPRDGGKLTFSFDAEVAGGVSALRRDQSVRFSDVSSTLVAKNAACARCACAWVCVHTFFHPALHKDTLPPRCGRVADVCHTFFKHECTHMI